MIVHRLRRRGGDAVARTILLGGRWLRRRRVRRRGRPDQGRRHTCCPTRSRPQPSCAVWPRSTSCRSPRSCSPTRRCGAPGRGPLRAATIWAVMQECIAAGCRDEGLLPGGLKVRRRAPELHRALPPSTSHRDPLRGHGLGQPVRAGGQRGERRRRPRRHRTDQRRSRHRPGRAAVLPPLRRGRRRRRGGPVPAHCRRDRRAVQG